MEAEISSVFKLFLIIFSERRDVKNISANI